MFSDIIENFKGKTVRTHIFHKLYGNQKLTLYNFQPLCVSNKIGFVVGNQEIFLYCDEIEEFKLEKNMLEINGTLQKIIIKKI